MFECLLSSLSQAGATSQIDEMCRIVVAVLLNKEVMKVFSAAKFSAHRIFFSSAENLLLVVCTT